MEDQQVRVVGVIMVPHWREGLSVDALPDVYQDIVEVVADAPDVMQAKQIVPRIGLPAVTAKTEGTEGSSKGWWRGLADGGPARPVRAGPPGHSAKRRAAAEITAQACRARLRGAKREAADACTGYLTSHLDRLGYDTALAQGWPIATRRDRGACRPLIGDRLDITGARWGLAGADAVLKLRALNDNGDFEEYWTFHLAQECECLCPTPDQHNYQLTA